MKSHANIWNMLAAVGVIALLLSPAVHASTVTLVQDTFNSPDGSPMAGRTPDTVDAPGSTWVLGNGINTISGNAEVVGNDGAAAVSIASAGLYTKPTNFTISAQLNVQNMTPGAGDQGSVGGVIFARGITLGFFDPTGVQTLTDVRRSPLGVLYNDSGYLELVAPDGGIVQVLAMVSTSDPSNDPIPTTGFHTLSYNVDTTTGNIAHVTFDGFPINFGAAESSGLFTDAATTYAGNYAGSGSGDTFGSLDNFTIITPEPASLGLLAAGGLVLLWRRRA